MQDLALGDLRSSKHIRCSDSATEENENAD